MTETIRFMPRAMNKAALNQKNLTTFIKGAPHLFRFENSNVPSWLQNNYLRYTHTFFLPSVPAFAESILSKRNR